MTTLVEFLEARLAEDQERAERGQWTAEFLSQGGRKDPGSKRAYAKDIEREGGYSPARVLREVEAKRRILREHQPLTPEHEVITGCSSCSWRDDWEELHVAYPCATVQLLAAPFADHPDYRSEWSPS